jgi:hypothetical protein
MLEISQKPGGKGCHAEHPLYTPIFPQLCRTPPENAFMNVYFYFYCVVKCGNCTLGINERIKKNLLGHKNEPKPTIVVK